MRFLIRTFNHRAYPVGVALLLGGLSVRLATDGVTVQDVIVLAVLVLLAFAIWLALVSRQSAGTDSLQQFRKAVANGNKPTIVQFFSRYCVGCLATKPVVDQLEKEAGERLQIIRLDIDEEPGRSLMKEYEIVYTPTFLYFAPNGEKLRESTFIVDRARVLYDLERASS